MNEFMSFYVGILNYIWKILKEITITCYIRNPCNKCIVKACCTQLCNAKKEYKNYCGVHGTIGFQKFVAISIVLCVLMLFIRTLVLIIN